MSNETDLKKAEDVENNWILAKGKKELLKHLRGEKISTSEAIKAKCYECCGGFGDEKLDCGIFACPLHPFHPYNENRRSGRTVSEEMRLAAGERFKKMWADKKAKNEI